MDRNTMKQLQPGNLAANPAYIIQVLCYVYHLGSGKKMVYGDRVKSFDKTSNKGAARVLDFMFGLDLIEKPEKNKSVVATSGLKDLYKVITGLDSKTKRQISINNAESNELKDSKGIISFLQNKADLYYATREMFFNSPVYEFYTDYIYESCLQQPMDEKAFRNRYWEYLNLRINNALPQPTSGKRGVSTGENSMRSLEQWLMVFGDIEIRSNGVYFHKDATQIVSQKIDKSNGNIVFTGAPGTGKTYAVRKNIKKKNNSFGFVQFHSSYDYSDFVEGLRPVPKDDETNVFVRFDGVFKKYCRNVVDDNIELMKNELAAAKSLGLSAAEKNKLQAVFDQRDFESIYGILSGNDSKIKEVLETLRDGLEDRFFVIDEINRADLSNVFGELMFSLEKDYKGIENRFETRLQNLPTYQLNDKNLPEIIDNDCFKFGFFIPKNVRIIGTMNDIDRSVESIDFALRRRFEWVEIKANEVMKKSLEAMGKEKDIADKALKLNEVIGASEMGLNRDFYIGPAYYKDYDSKATRSLETIFQNRIEPLLREYTRGREEGLVADFVRDCEAALFG